MSSLYNHIYQKSREGGSFFNQRSDISREHPSFFHVASIFDVVPTNLPTFPAPFSNQKLLREWGKQNKISSTGYSTSLKQEQRKTSNTIDGEKGEIEAVICSLQKHSVLSLPIHIRPEDLVHRPLELDEISFASANESFDGIDPEFERDGLTRIDVCEDEQEIEKMDEMINSMRKRRRESSAGLAIRWENVKSSTVNAQCQQCHLCFPSFFDMRQHNEREHGEISYKEKRKECHICKDIFLNHNLGKHLKAAHGAGAIYICNLCSAPFCTVKSVTVHKEKVHGVPVPNRKKRRPVHGKPFKCSICEYASNLKGNLIRHVKIRHLKEKPFHCLTCQKRFATKSNMVDHVCESHKL